MNYLHVLMALMLSTLTALPAMAQAREDASEQPAISRTKRFTVRGLTTAENVETANWAEEVAEKIEGSLGYDIPFKKVEPVVISFQDNPSIQGSRVLKQQRITEFGLLQKLVVMNFDSLDKEDLLEGLTGLLLNRFAISKENPKDRSKWLAEAPDWFAVGCAQNLYSTTRERNRQIVRSIWMQGKCPSFGEVLEIDFLPLGRSHEKAACGVAFALLHSQADFQQLIPQTFAQWGAQTKLTPEWIVSNFKNFSDPIDLDKYWDLWIATTDKTEKAGINSPDAGLTRLRKLMMIRPHQMGIAYPPNGIPVLEWKDLVDHRKAKWLPALCQKLILSVEFSKRGQDAEYEKVISGYTSYLENLTKSGLFGSKSTKNLLDELKNADKAFERYEKKMEERRNYLNQFSSGNRRPPSTNQRNTQNLPYKDFGKEPVAEGIR